MTSPIPIQTLLLFLSSILHFSLALSLFSPIDNYLLDCGSTSPSTALDDRRLFLSDSDPAASSVHLRSPGPEITVSADPNPPKFFDSFPLYRTARIFKTPSSYEFQIKNRGTHLIRLHFYPFPTPTYNLSSALFHVSASGFVLLSDFGFENNGQTSPVPRLKEYLVRIDAEKLVISFVPAGRSSFAFVNAIEVVSAPGDLIREGARLVKPDRIERFYGLSNHALQTLYRINVGGSKVTPFNDTLWRTWVPDSGFLMSNSPSKEVSFSGRIVYQKGGASREVAPDSVYSTARTSSSNMSWVFSVDSGYKYLVRLHFCDIASLALNELYFDVFVNGYLAYQDFDLSDATDQVLASPHYVDFVVDVESSGLLSIGIVPSKMSDPSKIDGLLNGLEIMKINNTVGSLDGEFPVALVLEGPRVRNFGEFLRSLVCGFAFVSLLAIVFVLVLRLRTERRDPVAWLPLPVDEGKLAKGSPLVSGK